MENEKEELPVIENKGKKYELKEFVGSEKECISFYEEHKNDCVAPAYLYERNKFRVMYWSEKC